MTNQLVKDADFREQLLLLLQEMESVLAEIEQRLADEARIDEIGEFRNREYEKLGEKPEDRNQEKMRQLEQRIHPLQEEIDSRYQQFAGTKHRVGRFVGRLRDTLNRVPIEAHGIRDARAEIERLDLFKQSLQVPRWSWIQTDLVTIRGRLEEMLDCLSAAGENPALETSVAGSSPGIASAGVGQRRHWGKNEERDRIISNCLARGMERRQICQELDNMTTPTVPSLRRKGIFKWTVAWDDSSLRKYVQQLFSKVAARQDPVKPPPVAR